MKYKSPDNQGNILPNLLGLTSIERVNESEFEGFLKAEIYFTESLNSPIKGSLQLMFEKVAKRNLKNMLSQYKVAQRKTIIK